MLANEFKAKLASFLWRNNFDKVLRSLGHKPRDNDRWQNEFWQNLNTLNECLSNLDQETFEKLIEAIS